MKLLVKYGADPNIPTMAPAQAIAAAVAADGRQRRQVVARRRPPQARVVRLSAVTSAPAAPTPDANRSATPRRRSPGEALARSRFTPRLASSTAKASPATPIAMRRAAGCRR